MTQYNYDLVVIGGGSGGVRASRMAAALGKRVAVVEDTYWGGTCVNAGCVPKKLFVYASHYGHAFEESLGYGWSFPGALANGSEMPEFNWRQLIENKDREIQRLNGIYTRLLKDAGATIIDGRGVIVDERTVEIGEQRITAERILVAVGGKPFVPTIEGHEHACTSDHMFHLPELPKSIVIVGGGYIAVEFAGIMHGLGVETHLVYRGELFLRGFDDDVRAALKTEMQNQGIHLHFNESITRIAKNKQGEETQLVCDLQSGGTLEAGVVMYATGRVPRVENLGLEALNIEQNDNGAIVVNEQFQTSVDSIYALGDVIDRVQLTPVALQEAMILVNGLYGSGFTAMDYANIPSAVFSQPNIGSVGLTEAQAREQYGDDLDIYRSNFRALKYTLTGNQERTLMKLIVQKSTQRVIGLHMMGSDAGEIVQGFAVAIKMGAKKSDFDATIGIHPTSAEEFVTMRG